MRVRNNLRRIKQMREKPITIAGGLSQNNDFNKVDPGSLVECSNYFILDSEHTGTTSAMGYERYDGALRTIDNPADPGSMIDVSSVSEVPVIFNSDFTDADDTAREEFRNMVSPLPVNFKKVGFIYLGGQTSVVGYDIISKKVQVFRPTNAGLEMWGEHYVANVDLDREVFFQCDTGRFSSFPAGQTTKREVVAVCTGLSNAFLLYQTEADALVITEVTHSALPVSPLVPKTIKIFDNQLWLGYGEGHLFNSDTSNPLEYDQSISTSNEWQLPHELYNMVEVPSGMILFMERGAEIIRLTDVDLNTGNDKVKENYSSETMIKRNTVVKYMGAAIYCSKRGIGMIKGANENVVQNTILTKRAQELYRSVYEDILFADIDRKNNQYEIYTRSGLILTLNISAEKRVNAIGIIDLKREILISDTPTDSEYKYFFFRDSHYLYRMHPGATSFDGLPLVSTFTTQFYAYGAENRYKQLIRATVLFSAPPGLQFSLKPVFDYAEAGTMPSEIYRSEPSPTTDRYGSSRWGERRYGGSGIVHKMTIPCIGRGTRIAFTISVVSKFHTQHTVHSITPGLTIDGMEV